MLHIAFIYDNIYLSTIKEVLLCRKSKKTAEQAVKEELPVAEEKTVAEEMPVAEVRPAAESTEAAEEIAVTAEPVVPEEVPVAEEMPAAEETAKEESVKEESVKEEPVTPVEIDIAQLFDIKLSGEPKEIRHGRAPKKDPMPSATKAVSAARDDDDDEILKALDMYFEFKGPKSVMEISDEVENEDTEG